ncbi:MAG TPA: hypothetical protein VK610_03505 [Rhodothermales bacterium]|nr:hypothetical protein [Rhodothermales bacterium]
MPWPFLIPIVAILAWAAVKISESRARHGSTYGDPSRDAEIDALLARLEDGEDERARLRARIENLEAIVTGDRYELDREARRALPTAPAAPQLTLDEEPLDSEEAEAQAARMASRARGNV